MLLSSDSNTHVQPLWVQALVAAVEPKFRRSDLPATAGLSMEMVLNALPVAVSLEDWGQNQLACSNPAALAFWGTHLQGKQFSLALAAERVCPPDRETYQHMRQQLLHQSRGVPEKVVLRLRDAGGEWRWMLCWLTVMDWTPAGMPQHILWCLQDVTEDKQNEARLRHALYHDPLTGLYNRTYFIAELARLSGGRNDPIGVIMLDVDTLKQVNDTLGHAAGDALLQRLGTALKGAFRHGDVVARIGGDEFVILLPHASLEIVQNAVERIHKNVQRSNRQHSGPRLHISLGTAVAEPGQSLEAVLQHADRCMYQDKAAHKSRR
jgi:diguanylate cyclase (GGDEF)-like protein